MNVAEFGAYAPGALQRVIIERSNRLRQRTWFTRKLASLFLRLVGAHRAGGVFDWEVFDSQRARLYPGDNLSEKRVLMTPHFWDPAEREMLRQAFRESACDRPFVFIDVGANAGLYSLYMQSQAVAENKAIRVVAVEPAPAVLERLRFNVQASQAHDIEVLPWAATEKREDVNLYLNTRNRGESSLIGEGDCVVVEGHPLSEIFERSGGGRVDAMKMDVEGAELPAIRGMFADAPAVSWPRLIVIEGASGGRNTEAIDLCLQHGYAAAACTRMNTVLRHAG
jgi:FkbM family methyltransferase